MWDDVLERYPSYSERLADLENTVDALRVRSNEFAPIDVREFGLGDETVFLVTDPWGPPGGIHGFGLNFDTRNVPRPVILVRAGLAPASGAPVDATRMRDALRRLELQQYSWPRGTVAVGVGMPELQGGGGSAFLESGMRIGVGAQRATLGVAITKENGGEGFTTAGHVVDLAIRRYSFIPSYGLPVLDRWNRPVGAISDYMTPTLLDPNQGPAPDMAIVEILPGAYDGQSSSPGLDIASEREDVSLRLGTRSRSSWVRTIAKDFVRVREEASWGNVLLTAQCISKAGDSGGPVYNTNDKIVGHIVGAHGQQYSIVQDLAFCLRELNATLR